jgi:two-component system sensor histidine kinase KdpD
MRLTPVRKKGRLKVYLGYAAGVGKTYQMLDEAQELHRKGVDVVIGYFEPHGRKDTIEKTEGLETVPRKTIAYRGASFEEMDTEAILHRKPEICLVDELAHTNVPGSERAKRWEDVRILLDAGINVFSTLNVQHLESLNDQVWQITRVRVRETLPDWVVDEADEVVLVDVTPRALRHRLERGVVYPLEKAKQAMAHFFAEQNLSALRELALRHAAHEIEERLTDLPPSASALRSQSSSGQPRSEVRVERILICLDEKPTTAMLIRRGKRVADYLHGDCFAAYILPDLDWNKLSPENREAIEKHLRFARNLRIDTHLLSGRDVAQTLVEFARAQGITQIYMGRSYSAAGLPLLRKSTVHRVARLARDMQVVIVSERHR